MSADTPKPANKQFTTSEIFPVPFSFPITGYDLPWDSFDLKTPKRKLGFHWNSDLIKAMILFWFSGETSMKLIGHTGTGKTEAVMQFHSALNLPLVMVTANPQMSARDLIGGFFPTQEGLAWRDGPVTKAARQGLSIIIDEYNVLDAGETTGLNAFLEGRTFTIVETGETVQPVPGFRVFVTINPKSSGYHGRQTQDLANDDRFVDVHTQYPPKDIEEKAIADYLLGAKSPPAEAANIAGVISTLAQSFRKSYMGENDEANALPCTMSMRCSMRMAKWTLLFQRAYAGTPPPESPLYMALDMVLANRQTPEVRTALRESLRLTSGYTAN
jgi:cobaltochelatase CobS